MACLEVLNRCSHGSGGREYVVYGFGGNPGSSFQLGDAVIAFALPKAATAAGAKAKAK